MRTAERSKFYHACQYFLSYKYKIVNENILCQSSALCQEKLFTAKKYPDLLKRD